MESVIPFVFVSITCALLLTYIALLHRKMQQNETAYQHQLNNLIHEMQAVQNGSVGVGKKVLGLEQDLMSYHNMLEDLVRNDPSRVSYTEASRLVEMGADVEDLMNACGISRPEAELVSALSRSQVEASQASQTKARSNFSVTVN